jgi:hypothetical protein
MMKRHNTYSYLLILISISISLQFDYLFFNVYFFVPFVVVIPSFILISFYSLRSISFFLWFLMIVVYYLFTIVISNSFSSFESLRRAFIYVFYIIVAVYVLRIILTKISLEDKRKAFILTVILSTLALLIECILRFTEPTLDLRNAGTERFILSTVSKSPSLLEVFSNNYFYAYKYSSIMFFDSNFTGLFALVMVVNILFYRSVFGKSNFINLFLCANIIFVFLSFSRSAMLVLIVILVINTFFLVYKNNKYLFSVSIIFTLPLFMLFLLYAVDGALNDGSFDTKVRIFYSLATISDHDVKNILFGFGVEEGGAVYSYKEGAYAHALIPLLLGQFGLIGLIIYFYVLISMAKQGGFYGWLLFTALFISGLSLADPWQILNFYSFLMIGSIAQDLKLKKYKRFSRANFTYSKSNE